MLLPLIASAVALQPLASSFNLVPYPASVSPRSESFELNANTVIVTSRDSLKVGQWLQHDLGGSTGYTLPLVVRAGSNRIEFVIDKRLTRLGSEGYTLSTGANGVEIRATQAAGLFYGAQTLKQLLPAAAYRLAPSRPSTRWVVPGVQIEDVPRFGWRGAMLDPCRHFIPKESVLRFIDALAMHKMNRLHFHLSDDQGWRIEIKAYPKLTTVGAWRTETVVGHNSGKYDGVPHGGYYTQDDIREIVAYAQSRFITVVPEIDMPGHMVAAITSYPELGDGKEHMVMREWGVSHSVLNLSDATLNFTKTVLDEICSLFPSEIIHIGGDECPRDQWNADQVEQARMKSRGVNEVSAYQSWFTAEMGKHLASKGRRLIGWDEILEGGDLPANAAVMSWRGTSGGIHGAKLGHDIVMAPTSHCYLDFYQVDPKTHKEPDAIGGLTPLDKVYGFEPVPAELSADEAKHILGTQGNLWSEYILNYKHVEYMAFPRLCALSEVAWSPKSVRDWNGFSRRLPTNLDRLTAMNVNFRPLDPAP